MPECDVLPHCFNHLLQVEDLALLDVGILLPDHDLLHGLLDLSEGADHRLQVSIHQIDAVEASTDELAHGDELLDLHPRDRVLEAVELHDAIGGAIVANNGRDDEIRDVLVRLDVVRLRVELRLRHLVEAVEVHCLSLAEGCPCETLIRRDAHHVVPVQNQVTYSHVDLELLLHLGELLLLLFDELFVLLGACGH